MPVIVECYGKNIYMNENQIGYIGRNVLYIGGKKFADITDEGVISYDGKSEIGYVDDDGYIIVNDEEVGYIDNDNNFVFYRIIKK